MALAPIPEERVAQCTRCQNLFDLDVHVRDVGNRAVRLFIENIKLREHFMCTRCVGKLDDESSCKRHLTALRTAVEMDENNGESDLILARGLANGLAFGISAYGLFNLPTIGENHWNRSVLRTDRNALNLLKAYGDDRYQTHVPIAVEGDGNCLFNCVSLALWGEESRSSLLRLITAIEIVKNTSYYYSSESNPSPGVIVNGLNYPAYNLFEFVKEVVTDHSYMSPGHLAALANSLCMPLRVTYPRRDVSHSLELNQAITLDTSTFRGKPCETEFCSHWSVHFSTTHHISSQATYESVKKIIPNHFVLLLERECMSTSKPTLSRELSREVSCEEAEPAVTSEVSITLDCGEEPTVSGEVIRRLPSGEPLDIYQCMDIIFRSKKEELLSGPQQFNMDLLGHLYVCEHGHNWRGTVPFDDGFRECIGQKYSNRNARKRIYINCNGVYKAVSERCGRYILSNGLELSERQISELIHMYTVRISYANFSRTLTWQCNDEWVCLGTVLVQYACKISARRNANDILVSSQLSGGKDTYGEGVENVLGLNTEENIEIVKDRFLEPLEAYDLITSGKMEAMDKPPVGKKANRRFLVQKAYCIDPIREKNVFLDELFVGCVGRTSKHTYSMPSRRLTAESEESEDVTSEEVSTESGSGTSQETVPTITVHRRKTGIREGRRCITWVTNSKGWQSDYLWEYLGCENAVAASVEKQRTHPNKVALVLDELRNTPPSLVYAKHVASGGNDFRNMKQLTNYKALDAKYRARERGACSSSVYADQVMAMLSSQNESALPITFTFFVDQLPAMFVLAESYVYEDIARFCMHHSAQKTLPAASKTDRHVRQLGVLGIDKTFNLTAAHVTTVVYKNLALKHKTGKCIGRHPYFLGPILIHHTSTEDIFRRFFTEIDTQLNKLGYMPNIGPRVIVCDGENALRNAIQTVWPQCRILHCFQHLKKDLERRLTKSHNGIRLNEQGVRIVRQEVLHIEGCLANARSVAYFDRKAMEVLTRAGNHDNNDEFGLQSYLTDVLFPKMRENIAIAEQFPDMDLFQVTNNPTESLNNVLKRRINYQTVSLTNFAVAMKELEYAYRREETGRAFIGRGDYYLSDYYQEEFGHKAVAEWYLTQEQVVFDENKKIAFIKKYQRTPLPRNYGIKQLGGHPKSTSSDGRLVTSVPSKRAGKKPGKRQCTSRAAKRYKLT